MEQTPQWRLMRVTSDLSECLLAMLPHTLGHLLPADEDGPQQQVVEGILEDLVGRVNLLEHRHWQLK